MEYEKMIRLECIRTTGKRPLIVNIAEIDEDTIEIRADLPTSSIARTRRITGYLSEQTNWNHAKKSELTDRKAHVKLEQVNVEA
jgi:hypothetical protein